MSENINKLETKFKLLALAENETNSIIKRNKPTEIEKQIQTYEKIIDEIKDIKINIQEEKLNANTTMEEITKWSSEIENRITKFYDIIEHLQERLNIEKEKSFQERKEGEFREIEEKMKLRFEEEKMIEEMRASFRISHEKTRNDTEEQAKVKLPKLIITKFNGTHLDWFRFWNQFETEIDKSKLSQVGKFSYLKELVNPNVRKLIDSLPFSTEGYERAKNILKSKYGKTSEVANAHTQNILNLSPITNYHPAKIHSFYEKLVTNVQALETMKKLDDIKGYVRNTLDKLAIIRTDLVMNDDNWQEWNFQDLVEALRKWTERNPLNVKVISESTHRTERVFQAKQQESRTRGCVYCDSEDHKATSCPKVTSISERKQILSRKKLCFNCTGTKHHAGVCRSRSCRNCSNKHHTSICDTKKTLLAATSESQVIYPVVVVKVNGVMCRALLDTGAGSSYISTALIDEIRQKPIKRERKTIEMMLHTTTRSIDIYKIKVESISNSFAIETEASKVERETLVMLPNPNYKAILSQYRHLEGVSLNDNDQKEELPIHLILGASEYAQIKVQEVPRVGKQGEPVAELTKFGWVLISPGKEDDVTKMLLTHTTAHDFDRLCSLDVLGIEENHKEVSFLQEDFYSQLTRDENGCYETGLIWKRNKEELQNNKNNSLSRLKYLQNRLQRDPELLSTYKEIMNDQLREGIIEKIEEKNEPTITYYMPHKPVVRKAAESTKVRVVYDPSTRASSNIPSLNEFLEAGPPLQNRIWDILIRARVEPIILCGDIKKAFLQIRIREAERDMLRFHWLDTELQNQISIYRFERLVFGLIQSPFILNAVIKHLLNNSEIDETIKDQIEEDIYVDDLITGSSTVEKVKEIKDTAIKLFKGGGFELHKWHSNDRVLEQHEQETKDNDDFTQTYAKEQFGVKDQETKILGLTWEKKKDMLAIEIPAAVSKITKRTILQKLASIYDPLGVISPIVITGKMIFRDICQEKLSWDCDLPDWIKKKWLKWEEALPSNVVFTRPLTHLREEIQNIDLHVFGDASLLGICAVAYLIIKQSSHQTQGLIASKSRIAKQGLTIPRLELVAAQTVANLAENIRNALSKYEVTVYGWSDSTTVLHWIKGDGQYKQFVDNRVKQIKPKNPITWNYVSSEENPADIGSRGCLNEKLGNLWWKGPPWLQEGTSWPEQILTKANTETEKEAKLMQVISFTTSERPLTITTKLLQAFPYTKAINIMVWVRRFAYNCRYKRVKKGPITVEERNTVEKFLIRIEQQYVKTTDQFENDQRVLGLKENDDLIMVCHGRIQGEFPTYLPANSLLSEKLVENAHGKTLHGGVSITMAEIRTKYWIPKLRQLVKRIIKGCPLCQRYQAKPFPAPSPGLLPKDRTKIAKPFEVIGTDFAGPLYYKTKTSRENKCYLLLFACSLTRAVHVELQETQTTNEFIKSMKRLIARRGLPKIIYSDNAKQYVAASKWVKSLQRSNDVNNFLGEKDIQWRFNLSRAPWWGGQFERMIGIVKAAVYKAVGRSNLTWNELEEVLLDVETIINNRPLSYQEDDVQLPTLTPHMMIHGYPTFVPTINPSEITDEDLRKRQKHVRQCKQSLWSRWYNEYVRSLRERHNMTTGQKQRKPEIGQAVLIKEDTKNKGKWTLGIIHDTYEGKDNIIRAVRVKTSRGFLERAPQHLYPLELDCDKERSSFSNISATAEKQSCNMTDEEEEDSDIKENRQQFKTIQDVTTNANKNSISAEVRSEETLRPKRDASVAARIRISEINDENNVIDIDADDETHDDDW